MTQQLAHLNTRSGSKELVSEHLKLVADRAKEYTAVFNAGKEGYLAGLLHDLGKYGELFQQRLRGEVKGIDHWSAGAWAALKEYEAQGIAAALAIQGHHIGLQDAMPDSMRDLNPQKLLTSHPLNLRLSQVDVSQLDIDGLTIPAPEKLVSSLYEWRTTNAGAMVDIRMLFSALVDADFIETEAWFQMDEKGERKYREPGLPLEASRSLFQLQLYMDILAQKSKSSMAVQKMRQDLLVACMKAAQEPRGVFTLTAPTGSGKTLAMLAFALAHAAKHGLRRIIVVIPYLNIIEQTAQVYRRVFGPYFSSSELNKYILEHHSMSGHRTNGDKTRIEDDNYPERLLTENWDSPIIVTTNVQLLESLFSNRPSTCRKLHSLAESVIIFDEAQTLPVSLAIPTLATLSRLAERYGSTVVFATATQPAFSHLDQFVKKHCVAGWQPREIVPPETNLFSRARRNRVTWPEANKSLPWPELADRMAEQQQALGVVNLKKHARKLFAELKQKLLGRSVFHLSTNMCPAHREVVLKEVRHLLDNQEPCYLISTQCIEAGVDIDFPVVYRSMGPLDAIAQAAGRCNRNGHLTSGDVYVFIPETEANEHSYPDGAYAQAASITDIMLNQLGPEGLDINDPETFQKYYRLLYSFVRPEDHKKELTDAIKLQDFVEVSQYYHVIDQDTINVLVPYDKAAYNSLKAEALNEGLSRQWIMKARPYTVSLFRPSKVDDPLYLSLESIKLQFNKEEESKEWYIYTKEGDYDPQTGLNPSLSPNTIIA